MTLSPKPRLDDQQSVLMTLASSGDNWVKLVIVGFLFWNGLSTIKNGQNIDKSRDEMAREIRVIYHNQKVQAAHWKHVTAEHDAMMRFWGMPPMEEPTIPSMTKLPEFETDGLEQK